MRDYEDLKLLNVLYADDDEQLRLSMEKTLSLIVSKVTTVSNGISALEYFYNERVDIILLDIRMGDMSGIDVAAEIRKTNKDLPIIIISSYTEVDDLLLACKLNLIDYLRKPVDFRALIDVLQKALLHLKEKGLLVRQVIEDVSYNYLSKCLVKNEIITPLTKNEILVFELLLSQRGKLITYETFFNVLEEEMSDGALKNLMLRLRKKIGEDRSIRNLSKIGYTLL